MGILRKFRRDNSGIAAVEAALVLPILLTLYIGSSVVFESFRAYREAVSASTTVADLVTRSTHLRTEDLDVMMAAGAALMSTIDNPNDLGITVAAIGVDDEGDPEIRWTESYKANPLKAADLSTITLPNMAGNETVILVEVTARYRPRLTMTTFNLSKMTIRSPRFVDEIGAPE